VKASSCGGDGEKAVPLNDGFKIAQETIIFLTLMHDLLANP